MIDDVLLSITHHVCTNGVLRLCLGLQTVGIFRVGSSKKRVRQVRKQLLTLISCAELNKHLNFTIFHAASRGV